MKSLQFISLGILLIANAYGQEEKLAKFTSQPNDWFSNFEFRALKVENPKKVKNVFVVLTTDLANLETMVLSERWTAFKDDQEVAIVGLGYKYQGKPPKGGDPKAKPMPEQKPGEASKLLKEQMELLINQQFPRSSKYGYLASGEAFDAVKYCLKTSPRDSLFWITEEERWFIPKDEQNFPEGLAICRNEKMLAKMLEAQIQNAGNDSKVVFVHDTSEDRVKTDAFVAQFIKTAVSGDLKKPLECNLFSEVEIRKNDRSSAEKYRTRLPDASLLKPWREVNNLVEEKRLSEVIEERIETGISGQPNLTLYMKLPKAVADLKAPKGVLCIATWMQEERSLKDIILHGKIRGDLLKWAEEHGMVVITWNTATLWKLGVSQADLERDLAKDTNDNFDQVALAWNKGIRRLTLKYNLPKKGYYLYGFSRGAQWGHRLALRMPNRFSAVHVHVASSYDSPHEASKNVLWLVTTGERDAGYQQSIKFYRDCLNLGYPVIIKAGPNLAHAESPEIKRLGLDFFEYCFALNEKVIPGRPPLSEENPRIADWMRADLKSSGFFGDFINQEVFTLKSGDWVSKGQRIYLPTPEIAEAWSPIINK
ncbi:MAG: hypothetical protein Q8Q59_05970 [Luteolibacter sp.]|nr:hypothetical protein [Luteolibacter sp.]